MGSLSSRPKVPSTQPVVIVQNPTPTTGATTTVETVEDPSQSASEARSENLLSRRRGRLGTVNTSLRGILQTVGSAVSRKTLLGE